MNYYKISILIKTNSQEQREQIFDEVNNKNYNIEEDDLEWCSVKRKGECDVLFYMRRRGGITDEVYELFDLPKKYPDITEEVWKYEECWLCDHRKIHNDSWEDIWTIDDAVEEFDIIDGSFSPKNLELNTYRIVYDNDGNMVSKEKKKVPYPIELMPIDFREEYERWKENPKKWNEDKKSRRKEKIESVPITTKDGNIVYLPF